MVHKFEMVQLTVYEGQGAHGHHRAQPEDEENGIRTVAATGVGRRGRRE